MKYRVQTLIKYTEYCKTFFAREAMSQSTLSVINIGCLTASQILILVLKLCFNVFTKQHWIL